MKKIETGIKIPNDEDTLREMLIEATHNGEWDKARELIQQLNEISPVSGVF